MSSGSVLQSNGTKKKYIAHHVDAHYSVFRYTWLLIEHFDLMTAVLKLTWAL